MAPETSSSQQIPNAESGGERKARLLALALFVLTVALYAPALGHSFIAFDDQVYVTENPRVQAGWTWQSFVWAFTTFHAGNWHPVTWLSHITDCAVFGLRPGGHHLTNVLLHAANASLLFLLIYRLTASLGRSAVVAALFAWHPAHVESVAWAAERKDVLSGLFFLLTIAAYVRHADGRKGWYPVSLGLFAIGLMSKPMLVTTPLVLLLLDYWPLRRRAWREKIPYFVLSVAASTVTLAAQAHAHSIAETSRLPLGPRAANAAVSCWRYVGELLFPHGLAIYYPYEHISLGAAIAAFCALGLVCGAVFYVRQRQPWLFVGWFWFLATLVPVIGLVQVGAQGWADRYTYLPSIGLFIAIAWWLTPRAKYFAAAAVAVLAAATCAQLSYWRDTRLLFDHAIRGTRSNYVALGVLASLSDQEGKFFEAESDCAAALRINPNYAPALFILGHVREDQGRLDEAMRDYASAIALTPYFEQARLFLGVDQVKKRQFADAETNYLAVLAIDPESASAHNDLGKLRQLQGRMADSQQEYEQALRLDPRLPQAHNNLAILMLQQGKLGEGIGELRQALKLSPTNSQTAFNLALALRQENKSAEALAAAKNALNIAEKQGDADVARRAQQMIDASNGR